MLSSFFKAYLKFTSWKAVNGIPPGLKKFVLVLAPHTSGWDMWMAVAFRSALHLNHIKFIGKRELFKPPLGFIFRKLGGIPVDRSGNHNFVDEVAALFDNNDSFSVALSPEGTRKKVDRLKTGFYHIARKAKVPIILIALDFEHKEFRFSPPIYTTENEVADMAQIIHFFHGVKGKNPELGLGHLSLDQQREN